MKLTQEYMGALYQLKDRLVGFDWAIFAGAAAVIYGSARELTDIDIITTPEGVERAHEILERTETECKDVEKRGMFYFYGFSADVNGVDVEFVSDLRIKIGGKTYKFDFDNNMRSRIKHVNLGIGGLAAPLISPEDLVAYKAICQRGKSEGKYDLSDLKAVMRHHSIDRHYLEERARRCGAEERIFSVI